MGAVTVGAVTAHGFQAALGNLRALVPPAPCLSPAGLRGGDGVGMGGDVSLQACCPNALAGSQAWKLRCAALSCLPKERAEASREGGEEQEQGGGAGGEEPA